MAIINKTELLNQSSMSQAYGRDYRYTQRLFMIDCEGETGADKLLDAMESTEITIGDKLEATEELGNEYVEALSIDAVPTSDTSAIVTIEWGVPQVPIITLLNEEESKVNGYLPWVWNIDCATRQEKWAYDINDLPITIKFHPPADYDNDGNVTAWMTDTHWAEVWNQQRFNRMVACTRYRGWTTATARLRFTRAYIENHKIGGFSPLQIGTILSGKVNDEIVIPGGNEGENIIPSGVWMCQGASSSTTNRGLIYDIALQFVYNEFGWDPIEVYHDPVLNNTPKLIADAIIAEGGMTGADITSREVSSKPYGAIRPEMHMPFDFSADPWLINLLEVTRVGPPA